MTMIFGATAPSLTLLATRRAPTWATLAATSLLALVACASDNDGEPTVRPPAEAEAERVLSATDVPTYADFLSRDTALQCAQLGALCASFGQERSAACDDVLPHDGYDPAFAGTYSPEGGAACLNERAARGLAGRLAREGHGEASAGVASACDAVFRGPAFASVGLGDRCELHSDCAPLAGGRTQCFGFAPEPRFCGGTLVAKVGDRCNSKTGSGLALAPGSDVLCDHARERYVAVPGPGEPCVNGACGPEAACVAAVCVERFAIGSPCETGAVCASGRCEAGTCVALGKRDEPCGERADCASGQCDQGRCGRTYVYRYVCE